MNSTTQVKAKAKEGVEKLGDGSQGSHSERKCPELQGYKRTVSTARNRDSSPSLHYGSRVPAPQVRTE